MASPSDLPSPVAPHRGLALALLCVAVCIIVMDGTIVNIALPTLLRELGGGTTVRQLQWIVDAYILVFAGLLMAAGSLGDRIGRRRVLLIGLALFAVFSACAGTSANAPHLIFWRALMGVGAALIFPATLALIVTLYPEPRERAKAIGAWAAMSGLGVAIGPVAGGFILENAAWGWVFLINVPLCLMTGVGVLAWVPGTAGVRGQRIDAVGTVLSLLAVGLLTFAIIEAPKVGWLHPQTWGAVVLAMVFLKLFLRWEVRCPDPMLDPRLFERRHFAGGSCGIAIAFLGLFGLVFLIAQYFQLVRGYGPLEAGLRTTPFAVFAGITALSASWLSRRVGDRILVSAGLFLMALTCVSTAYNGATTPYGWIVLQMLPLGLGLGLVNAKGTDLIMAGLPAGKAGIGSAVNDTARELGGALGVAAMGSVFAHFYSLTLTRDLKGLPIPEDALAICQGSVAAASEVARVAGMTVGEEAEAAIRSALSHGFLDGLHAASWLGAAFLVLGGVACLLLLPRDAAKQAVSEAEAGGA